MDDIDHSATSRYAQGEGYSPASGNLPGSGARFHRHQWAAEVIMNATDISVKKKTFARPIAARAWAARRCHFRPLSCARFPAPPANRCDRHGRPLENPARMP
jgi:hypothetical protein